MTNEDIERIKECPRLLYGWMAWNLFMFYLVRNAVKDTKTGRVLGVVLTGRLLLDFMKIKDAKCFEHGNHELQTDDQRPLNRDSV